MKYAYEMYIGKGSKPKCKARGYTPPTRIFERYTSPKCTVGTSRRCKSPKKVSKYGTLVTELSICGIKDLYQDMKHYKLNWEETTYLPKPQKGTSQSKPI